MYTWPNSLDPDKARHDQMTVHVRVVEDGEDDIEMVEPSEEMDERLHTAVMPQMVWVQNVGFQSMVSVSFTTADVPVDLACDVFLRYDGAEHRLGTMTTGRPGGTDMNATYWGQADAISVSGQVKAFKARTVDLILRPDSKVARQTVDVTSIYAGELVYKDVEIQRNEQDLGIGFNILQAIGSIFGGAGGGDAQSTDEDDGGDQEP
jgi:hypothetical protein